MKNVLQYIEKTSFKNDSSYIIDEYKQYTYQQLLEQSQKIGTSLTKYFQINNPVPVFMEKGIDCLSIFFGSVYAGCFYVLLNPQLPSLRLNQILNILESKYVITDSIHYDQAKEYFNDKYIILIDELIMNIDKNKLLSIRNNQLDTDPLYVQFTSGSTGVPKGVVVSHRSVIDFIDHFVDLFHITDSDVIGNQAPFDFDVSVKDIYSAMKTGATLVIIPKHLFSQPADLIDFICDHQMTTMIWAVSALCLISTFHGLDYKVPTSIQKILFSGEVMPIKHLKNWMEHLPNTTFINLYGPTEITCNCTYHIIDKNRNYDGKIPIGIPFDNEKVFLLDENDHLINESDKVGEICVGGSALALGYYHNKEQTNIHFVQNPLNQNYHEMIYRTGDLGYYNENHELYFSGRKDFQIKYRGHRIELEEIDKAIGNIEGIERCCCLFDDQKSRLYAFYIGKLDKKELFTKIKKDLPAYMIPSRIIPLDNFPLTKNGKIDRNALMKMGGRNHAR